MKKIFAGFCTAAVALGGFTTPSYAASNSASVTSPSGVTATVTIDDVVLTGNDCQSIPYTVTVTNLQGPDWGRYASLTSEARIPGSNEYMSIYAWADTPGTSTLNDETVFCPYSNPIGTYSAPLTLATYDGEVTASIPLTFTVSQATPNVRVRAKARKKGTVITAIGTIDTPRGPEGVEGAYRVETKTPKRKGGSGKWVDWDGISPNSFGKAVTNPLRNPRVPKGSLVRVTFCPEEYYTDYYCKNTAVTVRVR